MIQPMPQDLITLDRVSKTFPGQKALDDVSFEMRAGSVHCVLGQNGCGKSTLIKAISGYHTIDPGGRIVVGDEQLVSANPQDSARLGLRFVHQTAGIIPQLSALENLALGVGYTTRYGAIDWTAERLRVRRLLGLIGRSDLDLDRPMSEARAVDRSAVAIARAVDPKGSQLRFLFLDEPTAALPVAEVDHLVELVRRVRDRGIGVVYVTHRLDEVFRLGDTVTVLRDGRHVATRPVSELDHEKLIGLITGEQPAMATQRHLGSREHQTTEAEPVPPSLAVTGLTTGELRGISFTVAPGEVVGVAGLDGSGREDVCYALIGARTASYDSIVVGGTPLGLPVTPASAQHSGLVLAPGNRQPGSAVRAFNLRENITLPFLSSFRRLLRVDRRSETAAATQWIDRLAIRTSRSDDPSASLFSQLSGGNQQKVVLAKWLATGPRALLLDEPTSGVDVGAREAIYEVVRENAERGVGVLIASSDIQDFLRICDRVLVVRDGLISSELRGEHVTESALLDALMTAPEATRDV
jgi:ribose transport system ATP-binding protein